MTLLERLGGRQAIAQGISETFRALNEIPHPSHHEKALSDWLLGELRRHGLHAVQDGANNIMAEIPATPGREEAAPLILQGHLDMVCAVAEGSGFDPLRHSVTVVERDGFLCSDRRSSLGADNLLGNAAVLWLLSQKVEHGPLRLIFTTCEEVGLEGAKLVDQAWLMGCPYLLNTDGFHLGRAVVGSASGRRESYSRPLETEASPSGEAWRIVLSGGAGGHSGDDIHLGRANAVKLLAEFLLHTECRVAEFSGGTAHNAIAANAEAVILCPGEVELAPFRQKLAEEYGGTDPELEVRCTPAARPARVWTSELHGAVLSLTSALFHGVYAMHHAASGIVGASANVGKVWVQGDQVTIGAFARAARPADEAAMAALHDEAAARYGFTTVVSGYPGWPGDGDNPLVILVDKAYRQMTGRWMEITAVHVGIEPSVFQEKNPDLMMVSTGPDIIDAHSVEERAPMESLPDYALLLARVLETVT